MRRLALITATLLSTLVGGCASRPRLASYPPGPSAGGPPQRGGRIVLVREEDPDYLDPALSYGSYSAPIIECVFRTLLDYTHEPGSGGARLQPDLARSLPDLREGGTLYAFALRPDARFSAPLGRHVTAADIKYSVERLFRVSSPGISFYRNLVGADRVLAGKDSVISGLVARGDSLYVRLVKPDPIFLQIFTMSFTSPVPREVVDRWPNAFSQHTVATGPYRVAEFTPRRRVLMVRNPDYCGAPAWADTIELRLGVTPTNAVAMIKRGLIDGGMFEVPAGEYGRMMSDPFWRQQIGVDDPLSVDYVWMNVRVKPFNDPRVRQAVAWALDRRAVLKVWSGKGVVAGEFCPLGMPGARPLHRYPAPDRARARQLLREAGYPNGFSTKLFGFTAEPYPREMSVLQQQLAEVGIRAELELSEAASYWGFAGDTVNRVPCGLFAWYADYVDPSNFFDVLLNGERITPIHNNNLGVFDDPSVNAAITRAMATVDDSLRAARWRAIDERIMDLVPVVPMIHPYESRLYSPRVGGWYRHITRILKIEDLYVKRPAALASRS
jgi:peptide/nickel transport system substrate-binding protein